MSIEQFTIQPSSTIGIVVLVALMATGAVLLALAILTGRRAKTIRKTFVVTVIVGITIMGLGIWLFFATNTPSTITVGSGYVSIQSPSFGGAGNMNVTADKIASASIGHVGSGDLTLSKQHGTNYDHFNVGVFTLGNGKTAYVVSNNSTDLIIQLTNGEYVILGTSNTNALATTFSQFVYPLKPS